MGLKKRDEKSAAANVKLEKKVKTLKSENKLALCLTVIIINKWICCFFRLLLTQLKEVTSFCLKI